MLELMKNVLRLSLRHCGKVFLLVLLVSGTVVLYAKPAWLLHAKSLTRPVLEWAGISQAVGSDTGAVYWCPMHPQIKRKNANDVCPICNMALVPLEGGSTESPEQLTLTTRQIQQAGVAYAPVVRKSLYREIDTTGRIAHDERRYAGISSWIRGQSRIDKLHVNFTGEQINKGDLMAEIYSPELITAQDEYLIALKSVLDVQQNNETRRFSPDVGRDSLLASARKKLLYQGMPPEQITRLAETREVLDRIPIYAPASGTVIEKHVQEGQYVNEGDWLFHLADLTRLWIFADIFEEELPLVEVGQQVRITVRSFPNEEFDGKVSFIDPVVDKTTRTVPVRIEVENPQRRLKPGMFARIRFQKKMGEKLAVPANAVMWSGKRQVVIVKQGAGMFQPRQVRVDPMWAYSVGPSYSPGNLPRFGSEWERYHVVFSGLSPGEQVVTAGAFLLSAESQFQSVLTKMLPPEQESATLAEAVGQPVANRIRKVLDHYYSLSRALAEDQLNEIAERAEQLQQAAQSLAQQAIADEMEELARQAGQLAERSGRLAGQGPHNLHEARVGFGRVSRDLVALLANHGGQTLLGNEVFLFRCGMAKVGYENWLWWSPEKYNPYMGQKMLECGSQLEILEP